MSNESNDGGSVFPSGFSGERWKDRDSNDRFGGELSGGMTLRDYFAAQAIARYAPDYIGKIHDSYDQIAANCYGIADAMLKARDAK